MKLLELPKTEHGEDTLTMKKEIYKKIADLLEIPEDKQWFLEEPVRYYKENLETEWDIIDDEFYEDEDSVTWFCIVYEMIGENKAWELDWKEELGEFMYALEQILPDGLEVEVESLNEDDSIPDWAESINSVWTKFGYVLACFDIDSDSYVIFVCKKGTFEQLQFEANKVDKRIDLTQNL